MNKQLVYAFVPARSGSKGLPDKNILPIDGHPLMAYSIAFGLALGIDRVIVSTDSEHYAEIAMSYGAECPCLRSAWASSDTAMEEDILKDLDDKLPGLGIEMPDIWLRLKPTNPFRSLENARKAIEMLKGDESIDSVRHVTSSETRLQLIGEDGFLKPFLDGWPKERSVIRRTEFPAAYQVFDLDVLRHRMWREHGSAYMGQRVRPIIGEAITAMDINERDDFELVKALIESRPRPEVVARHLPQPVKVS
jgi:CMP-N,N'-diacetyllegionaminic acid synthase